jgi:hypothetical protein
MNTEKEYINYLIKNKSKIDTHFLDIYFLGEIDFERLIEAIDTTQYSVMSYKNFIKHKKINNLLEINKK